MSFQNRFIIFSFFLSIFYLIIRFIDSFYFAFAFLGDEHTFANDLNYFINNGYIKSVEYGISIPYTFISYCFYLIIDNVSQSLRLTGTLFTVLLILYLAFRTYISQPNYKIFFSHLFLLIGTTGGTFYGTNDSIFFSSYVVFIFELFLVNKKDNLQGLIIFLSSFFMIISRPVIIIYGAILLLGLFIFKVSQRDNFFFNSKKLKTILAPIALSLFLIGILNYPRYVNGNLLPSYSNKIWDIEKTRGISWSEWVYYSQLQGNKNRLGFFAQIVKWQEVSEYKKLNGSASLPQSFPQYLTHDFSFVVRRTLTSIIEIGIISIRYVGILLFFLPFYIRKKIQNKQFDEFFLTSLIIISGILIWAIIWPGLVQHRWLYPFYLMLIFTFLSDNRIIENKYMILNLILLDIVTIWALWKWQIFYSI